MSEAQIPANGVTSVGEAIPEEPQAVTATEDVTPIAEDVTSAAEDVTSAAEDGGEGEVDYAKIIAEDIRALRQQFDELSTLEDITELENPLRYAALRDLGLSPREAYLATSGARRARDTRSHLTGTVPKGAASPRGSMTAGELAAARDLFAGMSDSQIQALYKRVTN